MTKQQWDEVLRVNLDGMFNVTRNVVESMKDQAFGRIVNVSSVNAQKGQFSSQLRCVKSRSLWIY